MALIQPILIGTSCYSYPGAPPKGWDGAFYPDKKAKGFDELNTKENLKDGTS
jgi:inosine/xanthosine triphosphate pyrophosphatase family protein